MGRSRGVGMRAIRKFFKYLSLTLFALSLFPSVAFAYLDAGTGSFLFQMAIGAFLGALFVVKMYWKKLRTFVAGLFGRGASEDGLAEDSGKHPDSSE